MIEYLFIIFIWLLNFAICIFNAVSVGKAWKHDEYLKGWMGLVLWSAVVMSAAGFTWCYTIFIALLAGALGYLSPVYVEGALNLGYMVVIFPILMSGLVIWVHSLIVAYQRRDLMSVGIAGWNTFANVWNWYNAFRFIPGILKSLGGLFKGGGDSKGKGLLLMIVAVVVSVSMGIITTYALIKYGEESE